MKATGIVRRIDDLGRIVIPKEIRRSFGIKESTPMEYFIDGANIVIRKYTEESNKSSTSENDKQQTQRMVELAKENICQLLYIGIHNTDEHIDKHFGGEKELMDLIQRYSILLGDLIRLNKIESEVKQ